MKGFSFELTGVLIGQVERMLGTNIHLSGQENIPQGPKLFLVNHFTRFETFVLPYILYKRLKIKTRSLAHHSFFKGALGAYLERMGTISTKTNNRNKIIISDLAENKNNWIIYPEGLMVKDRAFVKNGHFYLDTPHYQGPPRTGAALMALKAEWQRQNENPEKSSFPVQIVPVNLSFYPLRPDANVLSEFAGRFLKQLPEMIKEELTIEGNFLLGGDMHVHFCEPISLKERVKREKKIERFLPSKIKTFQRGLFLDKQRKHLTKTALTEIYQSNRVNLDHLMAILLQALPKKIYTAETIMDRLKLLALKVIHSNLPHHQHLEELALFHSKSFEGPIQDLAPTLQKFYGFLQLAIREDYLSIDGDVFKVLMRHKKRYGDFFTARLNDSVKVIQNEVKGQAALIPLVKKVVKQSDSKTKKSLSKLMYKEELRRFNLERALYSKELEVSEESGKPILLHGKKDTAVLLCHGFTASPGEMYDVARAIHSQGYGVCLLRMAGHGSSSKAMKEATWKDWLSSFYRSVDILKPYKRLVVGGLSTGALIARYASIERPKAFAGYIAFNGAFDLRDEASHLAGALSVGIDLLDKLKLKKESLDYVIRKPAYPENNYDKTYIKAVAQLRSLIKACNLAEGEANLPALFIQSRLDPTVKADKAREVFESWPHEDKRYVELDSDEHVISHEPLLEKYQEELFKFLGRLN